METQKKEKKREFKFFGLINLSISLIFLLSIITIQIYYKEKLKKKSIEISIYLQGIIVDQEKNAHHLFTAVIALGSFMTLVCFFSWKDKVVALQGYFLFFILGELTFTLKLLFMDSRPCFENVDLGNKVCECDFGNPSGHTVFAVSIIFYLCYEFLFKNQSTLKKVMGVLSWILISFLVSFSRIYAGVHRVDQVALGVAVSYVIISIYFVLEDFEVAKIILTPGSPQRAMIISLFVFLGCFMMVVQVILRNQVALFMERIPQPFGEGCQRCFNTASPLPDLSLKFLIFSKSFLLILLGILFKQKQIVKTEGLDEVNMSTKGWVVRMVIGSLLQFPFALFFLVKMNSFYMSLILWISISLMYAINFLFIQDVLLVLIDTKVETDYFYSQKTEEKELKTEIHQTESDIEEQASKE